MFKFIVHHSAKLIEFLVLLQLSLSKPQYRHVLHIADTVIVSEAPHKTLTSLYGLLVDAPDPTNAADCLRLSPWQDEDLRDPLRQFTVSELLDPAGEWGDEALFVSLDDSLTAKDKNTRHLEPVSPQYDHTLSTPKKARYTNGITHIEVRLQRGECSYVYDWDLYLREETVRRLNRQRTADQRLAFRSKYRIVRAILLRLAEQLPRDLKVYVLFDSWYASNKLLKFCRQQGWHVICAIKSNRTLDGVKLSAWNQRLKHQPYTRVNPTATESRKQPYLVRALSGKLKNVSFPLCVLISKRHRGDKRPKYFLCTDLSLSPQQILTFYQQRWPIEVDNYYVKQFLGLGDFRVHSVEAVKKWLAIVFLAYTYLHWRLNHASADAKLKAVADVIRLHRQEHLRLFLHEVAEMASQCQDLAQVYQRFMPLAPSLVT